MDSFGPCTSKQGYGYKTGRPCVFLKLNKIFQWEPQYYDNPADLPDDMPQELKTHIAAIPQVQVGPPNENLFWQKLTNQNSCLQRQQIWVSCKGQYTPDNEKLRSIKFYPSQGFPAYYYPYLNQPGYLSPLIAVQFENFTLKEIVNVECRAWAKNIQYSGSNRDRKGSVTFQLLVD